MHVVILGAGRVGQHVAQSLSLDGHSVVLVDASRERLEEASMKMDVAVRKGIGTEWQLVEELMEESPELFLALTDSDEVNFVACSIAKSIGNPRTIARIRESRYLSHERFDAQRLFHVDHIVVPELLVTNQVIKIALNRGLYSESFFHGGILLRSILVSENWPLSGKTLAELRTSEHRLIVAVIRRREKGQDKIIFPHGGDSILAGDEVTLIGDGQLPKEIERVFQVKEPLPRSALIIGGSHVGSELARALSKKEIHVRLVEPSAERCYQLAEELPQVTILHQADPDYDLLRQEKVEQADLFVVCTQSEEKNLHLALLAKELACPKVITILSDAPTAQLAEKQGITHVVSQRVATSDRILALARAEKVTSIISLYDQRAEIMEVKVSSDSPIVGIPLSVLGPRLPPELLIAVIHNRGRLFIAGGTHIVSPQDEVIVVSNPRHRTYLEEIF